MEQTNQLLNGPTADFIKRIMEDRKVMVNVTKNSILYFFHIYFQRYLKYPPAPFHNEIFNIAQDDSIKRACVVAFRGAAKSTILNTAYVLWAVTGIQRKKFIVIASQTQQRAYDHLKDIRKEIEENELLRQCLGPFEEKTDKWNVSTLIIPKYQARISAISVEEGVRGIKEGPHRPSLIIADDIENLNSIKNEGGRDTTFNWLTGELLPLGDLNTKLVILGNFLHKESATMRFEKEIREGKMKGRFLRIPIIDEENNITWPGMFPTMESIEEFKCSIGNEIAWQREYMLNPIEDSTQIVKEKWLRYYDQMPKLRGDDYWRTFIAIDPAASQNEGADFTAMVIASVFGREDDLKIYIHPNPINEHLTILETENKALFLARSLGNNCSPIIVVEGGGYQIALAQYLKNKGFRVEEFKLHGVSKDDRLKMAASYVQAEQVFFPNSENASKTDKELIQQILNFSVEKHDDLADAFSMAICRATERRPAMPEVFTV